MKNTVAEPRRVVSEASTAVTTTESPAGSKAGATYWPLGEIVPSATEPPERPFTRQITELVALVVKPMRTFGAAAAMDGETLITNCHGGVLSIWLGSFSHESCVAATSTARPIPRERRGGIGNR